MLTEAEAGASVRLGCGAGELSELVVAETLDHGEDEFFDLLRLDLGFDEELGGTKTKLGHLLVGDLAAGVDDQRQGAEGWLLAEPFDEGEAVAIGKGKVEDEQVRATRQALAYGLLARVGVFDVDGGVMEAGDNDAGEVFIVLDEQDVGGAFAGVEDAAEFGEEEALVEGFLNPALGVAGELGTKGRREDTEDDDRNVSGCGSVAEPLKGLPSAEAGHVEIEQDGFDFVIGGEDEGFFSG
jgi:hypothetical protein